MKHSEEEIRITAIGRYLAGEKPVEIYTSMGRSKQWFFKWLKRYQSGKQDWSKERSPKPTQQPNQTSEDLEQTVIHIRAKLEKTQYAQIGATAIQWEMKKLGLQPLPHWTINRILKRHGLIRHRKKYVSSGKPYPQIGLDIPCSVFQMDVVGPRYIKGDGRFYSHNVIDAVSHQISLLPCQDQSDESSAQALIKAWKSIGLPDFVQLDNALYYHGSIRWPRSFGLVIRLCLSLDIQPVFVPLLEPWRQGIIERFNDVYNSQFFGSQRFSSFAKLIKESLVFEQFHNAHHRYSAIAGKTPNQFMQDSNWRSGLLDQSYQLPKTPIFLENGNIHLIRFIRSNHVLDVFGEKFILQKTPIYEYVVATICVEAHTITVKLDNQIVEEIYYPMPVDW